MVTVIFSSTIGMPSALMLSSGLSIFSWASLSPPLPSQELSAAVAAKAAVEESTVRRVRGCMVIDSSCAHHRRTSQWTGTRRPGLVTRGTRAHSSLPRPLPTPFMEIGRASWSSDVCSSDLASAPVTGAQCRSGCEGGRRGKYGASGKGLHGHRLLLCSSPANVAVDRHAATGPRHPRHPCALLTATSSTHAVHGLPAVLPCTPVNRSPPRSAHSHPIPTAPSGQ